MKIIIVSAMFPPVQTGTSFYTKNLADTLAANGHDISLVTVENNNLPSQSYNYKVYHLKAFHFPLPAFFKHFKISAFYLKNYSLLKKVVLDSGADVMLLVNHYLDIAFPAIYAAKKCSIPLVCSVGTQLQSSKKFRNSLLNFFDRLICGNLIFPFCNKVIAWDTQILKYLNDIHGEHVVRKTAIANYAPNGNLKNYLAHKRNYKMHNQILGVGAITEQRNFLPLIYVFILLAPVFPNLKLKIIGHIYNDEAVKLAYANGLGNRIVFTGEKPHDFVLEEMKCSDMFYASLTGKYIGIGTATIEAMLLGVPVVANTPSSLLGKITLNDMTNFVSSYELSYIQIAGKMKKLLQQKKLRSEIGKNGRRFVSKNMNWDIVSHDILKILSNAKDEFKENNEIY